MIAMRSRCGSVTLFLLTALACGHATKQPGASGPGGAFQPVFQEPRHRLVFQTPLVRVLDVRIPPGDTTAYHLHAARMVGIAVKGARIWTQAPGAPPGPISEPPAVPYVFDNWSQSLPYVHRVANVDTVPLHYVVAEWLARSGPEAAAIPAGPDRRLIEEGPTARVYQITLKPGAATDPHTHAAPGLTVQGSAGVLSEEGSPEASGGAGAGSWSWREARYRHVLRNEGSTPLVVYEIDWR